jgi:hypothetical protein
MIISIEREKNTPTPGKSPRYRAFVRAAKGDHAIFMSARNFGSVTSAREAMDEFFVATLDLRDGGGLPCGLAWKESDEEGVRAVAEVIVQDTPARRSRQHVNAG